ncbi:MAG: hypothetical protein IBJ12_11695 [Sphingomonadaceae bacterium]|nr:hypothetical protein [Sphingomonadaceae bacterium]
MDNIADIAQQNVGAKIGHFTRFACVDWSGAKGDAHAGIALAICEPGNASPVLVAPPRRYWSRQAIADWLLAQNDNLLIGFDFSFAPPLIARGSYLPGDDVPADARTFWGYVDGICDDPDLGAASFLERHHRRHFYLGAIDGVKAQYMHFRQCEMHYNASGGGKPSTVYDAIGAAQVAKASFAGMRLLHQVGQHIPIWPFDPISSSGPQIVEIYTQIAARAAGLRKGLSKIRDAKSLDGALAAFNSEPHKPLTKYSDHATDAILTAAWLRYVSRNPDYWAPTQLNSRIAATEGWTFGVV